MADTTGLQCTRAEYISPPHIAPTLPLPLSILLYYQGSPPGQPGARLTISCPAGYRGAPSTLKSRTSGPRATRPALHRSSAPRPQSSLSSLQEEVSARYFLIDRGHLDFGPLELFLKPLVGRQLYRRVQGRGKCVSAREGSCVGLFESWDVLYVCVHALLQGLPAHLQGHQVVFHLAPSSTTAPHTEYGHICLTWPFFNQAPKNMNVCMFRPTKAQ